MSIEKLLIPDLTHRMSNATDVQIADEIFQKHFDAIETAYQDAGIDAGNNERLCPGITENGIEFQANVSKIPDGTPLGTHYFAADLERSKVVEVDIFGFKGTVEASSGRYKSPDSRYLQDYHITPSNLAVVTAFILERCDAGAFSPVEEKQILPVPQ